MNRHFRFASIIALLAMTSLALSCQTQPQVVPTIEPTPTDEVLIVIVTATSQPTLAAENTLEPTITPLATFTPVSANAPGTNTPAPTARATATRTVRATATDTLRPTATPRVSATLRPRTPTPTRAATVAATSRATVPPASEEASPTPKSQGTNLKYPDAPVALRPSREFRDAVNYPNAIEFVFQAVGPLEGNECYRVRASVVDPKVSAPPSNADTFVDHCGDRSAPGKPLKISVLSKGPLNYGDLLSRAGGPGSTDLLTVTWSVQVVRVQEGGAVTPLSPRSSTLDFDFRP